MARGLFWGDGIELTTASYVLGIAHPTGYPLFTILGKLFQQIPIGSIAFRMNLMTAFFGSLTSVAIYFFLSEFISEFPEKIIPSDRYKRIFSAIFAITFSLSRIFWSSSTSTEVYTLNMFFFGVIFLLICKIIRTKKISLIFWLSFILGLSFDNHLITIICVPSALISILYIIYKEDKYFDFKHIKYILICIFLFLTAISFYLYLPIRASANPPMNWGNPNNWERFVWCISGGQFKQTKLMKATPDQKPSVLETISNSSLKMKLFSENLMNQIYDLSSKSKKFKAICLLGFVGFVLIGVLYSSRINPINNALLLLIIGLNLLIVLIYNIPDIETYYLPAFLLLTAYFFIGMLVVYRLFEFIIVKRRLNYFEYGFIVFPIIALISNFAYCDKSKNNNAEIYVNNICKTVAQNSLIITNGDNDIYTLWYMQNVEKKRTDLVVFGQNFITSPWYKNYFLNKENKLVNVDMEYKPLYSSDEEKFLEFVKSIIRKNIDTVDIYCTEVIPMLDRPDRYPFVQAAQLLPAEAINDYKYLPTPYLYKITNNPKFSKQIDKMFEVSF